MPRRLATDNTSVEIDGPRMRSLRKLQGDSIAAFAEKVGISYAYVSQIECGHKPSTSPDVFVRICGALAIDATERPKLMSAAARRRHRQLEAAA